MKASETLILEELHDAYMHCRSEKLDLYEVGMEEDVHEYENEKGDTIDYVIDVIWGVDDDIQ